MDGNGWQTRWTREQITALLLEQAAGFWARETGIERQRLGQILSAAPLPHVVIVSGLRRVGKSTLLAQLAHRLGQDHFYYLNFEDERFLGFAAEDFNFLYSLLIENFGERRAFLIDEIQNIPAWERFVRRFMDDGFKFYLTGSNASLLSRELGTRLTGRYISVELFPFSFEEYLRFMDAPVPDLGRMTTVAQAQLQRHLQEYLRRGGLPESLRYPELALARSLYDDVLYRDIATRYNIGDVRALKELAYNLISNPATLVSFNRLKEQLRLGSASTVSNYIEYLENSWLLFMVNLYDYSVKRQQVAPKKVYCIDTGLANTVGFSFSPNTGRLLENCVYLALRRAKPEVYYFATGAGAEVDFYLPQTRQLIQVTQSLTHAETRQREVRALSDAMSALDAREALILTETAEDPIEVSAGKITVQSVAQWLLKPSTNDP